MQSPRRLFSGALRFVVWGVMGYVSGTFAALAVFIQLFFVFMLLILLGIRIPTFGTWFGHVLGALGHFLRVRTPEQFINAFITIVLMVVPFLFSCYTAVTGYRDTLKKRVKRLGMFFLACIVMVTVLGYGYLEVSGTWIAPRKAGGVDMAGFALFSLIFSAVSIGLTIASDILLRVRPYVLNRMAAGQVLHARSTM